MKKSEFKNIIKPIVKECIQEALIEEGLLSGIVSEVVKGLNVQPIVEQVQVEETKHVEKQLVDEGAKRRKAKAEETRKKMLEAIGQNSYNGVDLFEGTSPMRSSSPQGGPDPMANMEPGDAGIDISSLMDNKRVWDAILEGKK